MPLCIKPRRRVAVPCQIPVVLWILSPPYRMAAPPRYIMAVERVANRRHRNSVKVLHKPQIIVATTTTTIIVQQIAITMPQITTNHIIPRPHPPRLRCQGHRPRHTTPMSTLPPAIMPIAAIIITTIITTTVVTTPPPITPTLAAVPRTMLCLMVWGIPAVFLMVRLKPMVTLVVPWV